MTQCISSVLACKIVESKREFVGSWESRLWLGRSTTRRERILETTSDLIRARTVKSHPEELECDEFLDEIMVWKPWSADVTLQVVSDARWNPSEGCEASGEMAMETIGGGAVKEAKEKAWICPCGCRTADVIILEVPWGRMRCACHICQWTAHCGRVAEPSERLCAYCVGELRPGGGDPPPPQGLSLPCGSRGTRQTKVLADGLDTSAFHP